MKHYLKNDSEEHKIDEHTQTLLRYVERYSDRPANLNVDKSLFDAYNIGINS